jgi:hypothetical protein
MELTKDGRSIPKKADGLNAEPTGIDRYGTLDQKNVTAWRHLRNKAVPRLNTVARRSSS